MFFVRITILSILLTFLCFEFITLKMEKTIAVLRERLEKQQTQASELKTKYKLSD